MNSWIITGGTKGLGRALAEELLDFGQGVIFCARTAQDVAHTVDTLQARGSIVGVTGTIAEPWVAHQLVAKARERFGGVDGIIANASVLDSPPLAPVCELDPLALQSVLSVNLFGALHLIQAAHTWLKQSRRPTILALTSDAAHSTYPGWSGYGLSKAALEELVLTYGKENPEISTLVIDPGDMDTALHQEALPQEPPPSRHAVTVAKSLKNLWQEPRPASGRYILTDDPEGLRLQEVSLRVKAVAD